MMERCLNCNKEISSIPKSKPKKYCNDKCRLKYWNKNRDKLKKRAFYQIKCRYCGKTFSSYGNKGQKYCNLECYKTDRWQKEYQIKYQANISDKKSEALKLRDEYFSYGKIAKFLGISRSTVKTWCRRSGKSIPELPAIKNIEEFQKRLELMSEDADLNKNQASRKFVVCGITKVSSSIENLCTIIEYQIGLDPFSGDTYIFCDWSKKHIKYVWWDGSGLCRGKRTMQKGRYLWPSKNLGNYFEISDQEFEILLKNIAPQYALKP